ncbi:MAG: hypothetical protein GXP04_05340 [Alphaproteobacteria bacterium]|nr:hypothetical protein [Alphaproteobacteria bacterium]
MSLLHRNRFRLIIRSAGAGACFLAANALAHPHDDGSNTGHDHGSDWVHENGIGPDPDNDSNPATITGTISITGDAAEAADDPPYAVITFEPPPGEHGDVIKDIYKDEFGVEFGPGLTRQICEGQRRFLYNSMCTYAAAPSGKFSAGYLNYLNSPLVIKFERPVCVVTMAIYPTGGKEGEPFEFTIEGWTEDDKKLPNAVAKFNWTNNTVRWRHMAGAYYLDQPATKISISMESKDGGEAKKVLRYLIDDLAFVETACEDALAAIAEKAGDTLDDDDNLLTNKSDASDGNEAVDATAETPSAPGPETK